MILPTIKIFVVTLVALGATVVVRPSHVQPALGVKPVGVQHFSQLSEPNDIQPAMGVRVLQDTASPEPNVGVFGNLQPAARVGNLQRTFDPQQ